MNELIEEINNAFFHLEQFINEEIDEYIYFGFYSKLELFVSKFSDVRNITKANNDLLYFYNDLINQIGCNFQRYGFINKSAHFTLELINDCNELIEFTSFMPLTTVAYLQKEELLKRQFSITDILKTEQLKPKNKTVTQENKKLSLNQIALKYIYEGNAITRSNGNHIAKKYGHNSGAKLYQVFLFFFSRANRKGKPNPFTKRKLQNKIKLFETVIGILDTTNSQQAKDELDILKGFVKDL